MQQVLRVPSSGTLILTMEVLCCSKILVMIYQTTWHYIPPKIAILIWTKMTLGPFRHSNNLYLMIKTDKISMAISIRTYTLKFNFGNTWYFSSLQWHKVIFTVLKSKHTNTVMCVTHGVGVRFRSLCRCLSRSRLLLRERSLDFSIFFFPRSFSLSLDRLRDRRDLSRRSLSFSLSLLRLRRCDFLSTPILITKHD